MRHPAVLACLALCAAAVATPAAAADMAAHHAVYDLALDQSRPSEVSDAHGSMTYEVSDACDGWAVRQHLDLAVTNSDGQQIEMQSEYATWESKDGRAFRFFMKQTTDTAVTSQTEGEATLRPDGSGGTAIYRLPHEATQALPKGTYFPMAHTVAILDAARAGKRFLAVPLFDGTVEAGAQDSFITILKWMQPEPAKWPVLSALPSARVHIAFFDRTAASQTPDYEVGMRYWDNGIADGLNMNFGDFVVNGTLRELTIPPRHC